MMSTHQNNNAHFSNNNAPSEDNSSVYRWNPYGIFQKSVVLSVPTPSAAPSAYQNSTPAVSHHGGQFTSPMMSAPACPPAAHYQPTPEPQQQNYNQQQYQQPRCYDAPTAPNQQYASIDQQQQQQTQAPRRHRKLSSFSSNSSSGVSSNSEAGLSSHTTDTNGSQRRRRNNKNKDNNGNQNSDVASKLPCPSVDAVKLTPSEHRRLVLQWVNYARSMSCDERVDSVICGLSPNVQCDMLDVILCVGSTDDEGEEAAAATPHYHTLFKDLCTSERGNVVTQLLREVGTRQEGIMYQEAAVYLMETHWDQLTKSQFGCIALTRLFQVLPACPHQERLAHLTLQTATPLALHQFGNFMVSEVLKTAGLQPTQFGFVYATVIEHWSHPSVFLCLAESRFGSHVLETLLKSAPQDFVRQICTPLLTTEEGIEAAVAMGFNKQSNYPLQAALRTLSTATHDAAVNAACDHLMAQAKPILTARLEGSDYSRNLVRAMMPQEQHRAKATSAATAAAKPAVLHDSNKKSNSRRNSPPQKQQQQHQQQQQQSRKKQHQSHIIVQHQPQEVSPNDYPYPVAQQYQSQQDQPQQYCGEYSYSMRRQGNDQQYQQYQRQQQQQYWS